MKKDAVVTVRVESEIHSILNDLAKKDDRTVAWIARTLIAEALEARNLLPSQDKEPSS
ncbi:hypothetical protein [Thalassomonas actiniarum]|uniref:CopG-like ribbon-helix-helix domain-containing protein n=1 Tax=Thalassomonas actiniarum TaxID=485447 RepID=A0AAE9YPK9_9GAMM|nr:hypothetical protein [Thalassomonas actiniarum]WDD97878.1 hypothetical protein SG35_021680 [Thalassomonas actiniarum]